MSRGGALVGLAVLGLVLLVLAAGGIGSSGSSEAGSDDPVAVGASADPRGIAPTSVEDAQPVGPPVDPEDVPELRDRSPQQDVSQDDPEVRAYERTHRLLQATPVTSRGVTFEYGARRPRRAGRLVILARPNGLGARAARRAYRALLRDLRDPGTAYELHVARSQPSPEPGATP